MRLSASQLRIAFGSLRCASAQLALLMEEHGITLEEFFRIKDSELVQLLGAGTSVAASLYDRESALAEAKAEEEFVERHSIRTLFFSDDDYPFRLRECPDAPPLLFMLGNANLNSAHILSIVGTRRPTAYGVQFCEQLIEHTSQAADDLLTVSGLAYGIDASAHQASLATDVPTVAVLAHGLDMIYPAAHRGIAQQIVHQGGAILSEYHRGVKPFRNHFLERNRIIAGLADATVVAESAIKGGAMSTANIAFSYNREVFAVPGRIGDEQSSGCNHLIKIGKAHIATSADDVADTMGWTGPASSKEPMQRHLFPELEPEQRPVCELLRRATSPLTIDEMHAQLRIPIAQLLAILGELEFDGVVVRLPGNRYEAAL